VFNHGLLHIQQIFNIELCYTTRYSTKHN